MNKTKFLIAVIAVLSLSLAGVHLALYLMPSSQKVSAEVTVVLTNKAEYVSGEVLQVKIENKKKEKICFSSCYPYYFQREGGSWNSYLYEDCNKEDVVENCVEPQKMKTFELTLPSLKKGVHRLLLSACAGCEVQQSFEKGESLFSNKFIIK